MLKKKIISKNNGLSSRYFINKFGLLYSLSTAFCDLHELAGFLLSCTDIDASFETLAHILIMDGRFGAFGTEGRKRCNT